MAIMFGFDSSNAINLPLARQDTLQDFSSFPLQTFIIVSSHEVSNHSCNTFSAKLHPDVG